MNQKSCLPGMTRKTSKMKNVSIALAVIVLFSCNLNRKSKIKKGKYFAAHGFQNEYIMVTNDSSYALYVAGKLVNSSRLKFLPEKGRVSFLSFTEPVDWETGLLISNPRTANRLFKYRTVGILDAGFDQLNFIHETLWDTAHH